jgi:myo-inositol 2-dehydrogenase/D-chiro-inositol 1-dehydrogenase
MTIRVGIIGTGVMGADHARILDTSVSGATVSALSDVDGARAKSVAQGLAGARVVDDPDELIDADDVDAIVVASADPTHETFVLACLAAGKPVLCEKPLAPTEAAARRILDAEGTLGRSLVSVGFMRRFDPGYVELKAALDAGVIGAPLVVHCIHRNATAPAGVTGAEVIAGSVIHEIDAARWLLGEEIVAVRAAAPSRRGRAEPTLGPVLVTLESASGTVVDVEDVRCEVVGETGAISLDAPAATVTRVRGQHRAGMAADWRPRFAAAYRVELQDWISAQRDGIRCGAATVWDGYVATVVAERAAAALAGAARVTVDVPDRPALYDAP